MIILQIERKHTVLKLKLGVSKGDDFIIVININFLL